MRSVFNSSKWCSVSTEQQHGLHKSVSKTKKALEEVTLARCGILYLTQSLPKFRMHPCMCFH